MSTDFQNFSKIRYYLLSTENFFEKQHYSVSPITTTLYD